MLFLIKNTEKQIKYWLLQLTSTSTNTNKSNNNNNNNNSINTGNVNIGMNNVISNANMMQSQMQPSIEAIPNPNISNVNANIANVNANISNVPANISNVNANIANVNVNPSSIPNANQNIASALIGKNANVTSPSIMNHSGSPFNVAGFVPSPPSHNVNSSTLSPSQQLLNQVL
jgi:hypothetical protein